MMSSFQSEYLGQDCSVLVELHRADVARNANLRRDAGWRQPVKVFALLCCLAESVHLHPAAASQRALTINEASKAVAELIGELILANLEVFF